MEATSVLQLLPTWTPLSIPTSASISTINPTNTAGLALTLLEIQHEILTQTNTISLYFLSKKARGLAASITLINDQEFLATATAAATQELAMITQEMVNATLNLKDLEWSNNLYAINLSVPFNLLFTVLFGICLFGYIGLGIYTRKNIGYFTICFICGTVLELVGYLSRTIAHYLYSDPNLFLCQIITLTIAPTFIMASIYYLLAQLMVIVGAKHTLLKPRWVCYIFIICDVISLIVQATGGATAAIYLRMFRDSMLGTYIMVGGIAFQVVSMTLFLLLLFDFIYRGYFKINPNFKFSFMKLFHLFFNTSRGKKLRNEYLEPFYNPDVELTNIRQNRILFNYMPLIMVISVTFIYIRCVYRVIELSEGWRGYLITHEEYIFVFDALMVLLTCFIFMVFHPCFVFGKEMVNSIKTKTKSKSPSQDTKRESDEKYDYKKDKDYDDDDDDNTLVKDWDIKTLPNYSNDLMMMNNSKELTPNPRDWNAKELTPNIPISQKYTNPYFQPTKFSQYEHQDHKDNRHDSNDESKFSSTNTYTNNKNQNRYNINNNYNNHKNNNDNESTEFEFQVNQYNIRNYR